MTSLLRGKGSSQDRPTHCHTVAFRRASGLCDMQLLRRNPAVRCYFKSHGIVGILPGMRLWGFVQTATLGHHRRGARPAQLDEWSFG